MEAKREKMKKLPEFMMLTGTATISTEEAEREELLSIVNRLPSEKVRDLLKELRENPSLTAGASWKAADR